jgi:hypothetical protein
MMVAVAAGVVVVVIRLLHYISHLPSLLALSFSEQSSIMSMKAQLLPFGFDVWCISIYKTMQGNHL